MLNFRRILFPVDFSERCTQTACYVAAVARKLDSHVTLLHVFDIYAGGPYGAAASAFAAEGCIDSTRQRLESELAGFGRGLFQGLNVSRFVETGEPAETIARYACEQGIDLIAMPTHGWGRFRAFLLGSVTAKVLHDTPRPVLTTAHSEALNSRPPQEIRSIVCGVDLGSEAIRVIHAASDVVAKYGAVVHLVHGISAPEAMSNSNVDAGFRQFLFDTASERIRERQKEAGTNWEVCVAGGSVAGVLRQAALVHRAELVVIGRGRLHETLGRLRTNVGAIIRESSCPVLSV